MSTTEVSAHPTPFPSAWESPDDAGLFWERELMHFPGQASPLDTAVIQRFIGAGFNHGCTIYDMPVRQRYSRLDTYLYQSLGPVTHDPDELAAIGARAEARLGEGIATMRERWETRDLPEIRAMLDRWEAFDLAGASDAELAAHVAETDAAGRRAWQIHFETVFPPILALSLFDDLHAETLGGDQLQSMRLTQGYDNKSLEADRALWRLSRRALEVPAVREVLERDAAEDVVSRLEEREEGRAFLAELAAYLDEFGRRSATNVKMSDRDYVEDPTPLIVVLKDHIGRPERDMVKELAAAEEDREIALVIARDQLSPLPAPVREQFEFLLQGAQYGGKLGEDHNYWIDGGVMYAVRRVIREVGRRMAAFGGVDRPEDVVMLTWDEMAEAAASPAVDRRVIVAERAAEMAANADLTPPPVAGTMPPGPPPDDPLTRAVFKFFGAPVGPPERADLVKGHGVSAGTARGTARVIRSLADAGRLQAGDVLVCETTAPPWTPLFGIAGAIVTDSGGVLSHAAVVAREYMIPAVGGTGVGTHVIPDGATVEVDGAAGTVRILEG